MVAKLPEFPKVIQAALALDAVVDGRWEAQFALGDALLEECGAPGPDGVNSGALIKAAKVVEALKLRRPYTFRRLEQFRQVAHEFEARRRLRALSFDAHLAAGDPDTLDQIVKEANAHGVRRVTARYVERMVVQRDGKERAKTRNSDREKQSAVIVAIHAALSDAKKALALREDFDQRIDKHITKLTRDLIKELAQNADAVAASWMQSATNLLDLLNGRFGQAAE